MMSDDVTVTMRRHVTSGIVSHESSFHYRLMLAIGKKRDKETVEGRTQLKKARDPFAYTAGELNVPSGGMSIDNCRVWIAPGPYLYPDPYTEWTSIESWPFMMASESMVLIRSKAIWADCAVSMTKSRQME
jgi:hypothetical protein